MGRLEIHEEDGSSETLKKPRRGSTTDPRKKGGISDESGYFEDEDRRSKASHSDDDDVEIVYDKKASDRHLLLQQQANLAISYVPTTPMPSSMATKSQPTDTNCVQDGKTTFLKPQPKSKFRQLILSSFLSLILVSLL